MKKIVLVLISTAILFLTACTGAGSDVKKAAKEYEAYIDEYCAYTANLCDSDTKDELLSKYDRDKMTGYAEGMAEKMFTLIGKCNNESEREYARKIMEECDKKMDKSDELLDDTLKKLGFTE